MTDSDPGLPDVAALADADVDADALFDVLADSRRRFVIACLDEYADPMALRDVADELATWERDAPITDIPADEVESIHAALYHVHVPKMVDAGIVDYCRERDAVALAADVPVESVADVASA